MAQAQEIARVLARRTAAGLRPCDAPCAEGKFGEEFYLGSRTGDIACTVCGQDWPKAEFQKLRQQMG